MQVFVFSQLFQSTMKLGHGDILGKSPYYPSPDMSSVITEL